MALAPLDLNAVPSCRIGQERVYDHRNLFAQEVTVLAQQAPCRYLQEMDQIEYGLIMRENQAFKEIKVLSTTSCVLGWGTVVFLGFALNPVNILVRLVCSAIGGITTTSVTNSLITGPNEGLNALNHLIVTISAKRITRLDQKITDLNDRITLIREDLNFHMQDIDQ